MIAAAGPPQPRWAAALPAPSPHPRAPPGAPGAARGAALAGGQRRRGAVALPRPPCSARTATPHENSFGDEGGGRGGASHRAEDEFSVTQFVSVFSGLVGSFLSSNAFSKQREASKKGAKADDAAGVKSARIVQQLGGSLLDQEAESPLFSLGPVPPCTEASDMRGSQRHFTIVTTAALPWLTGTAVNPLLRALYLAKSGRPTVLVVPWMEQKDQEKVFPGGQTFADRKAQEECVVDWCRNRAKIDPSDVGLKFAWYPAAYVPTVRSIFPTGDPSQELDPDSPRDVLILEEPEHLCWYHQGRRWPEIFPHVVGIIHTNYQDYLIGQGAEEMKILVPDSVKESTVFAASTIVCSAYCDVNIKLSDTIMPLPNEVTCNVHGVRQEFLAVGDSLEKTSLGDLARRVGLRGGGEDDRPDCAPAYYLGKALFEKGWGDLLKLLEAAGPELQGLRIDGYGSGIDHENIVERAAMFKEDWASLKMHPGLDHANKAIHGYGVLINPSTSDVLCTVTVESLAMGKRVVLARHPSNRFFQEYFPDRTYFFSPGDVQGFVAAVKEAVAAGPPQALPQEQRHVLTWEAANERLFTSAEVRVLSGPYQRPSEAASSRLAYRLHSGTMRDKTVSEIIKEATLGDSTPWDTNLKQWSDEQMEELEAKADTVAMAPPPNEQGWERALRERIRELDARVKKTINEIVK